MTEAGGAADFEGITAKQAIELQKRLAEQVCTEDRFEELQLVAGVDVGFEDAGATTRAAIAVLDYESLELVEQQVARLPTCFPYVPGLLSFREIPAILRAVEQLERQPQMFLCDGQGIAHPRRLGVASHLGILIDKPTIGVAKSRLIGHYDDLSGARGTCQWLYHRDERIGAVLRTRKDVKPVFVSTGHRVSLESAIDIVFHCTPRFRLPETTRQAHRLASG